MTTTNTDPEPEAAHLRDVLRQIRALIEHVHHRCHGGYSPTVDGRIAEQVIKACDDALARKPTNGDVIDKLRAENSRLQSELVRAGVATVERDAAINERDGLARQLAAVRAEIEEPQTSADSNDSYAKAFLDGLLAVGCVFHLMQQEGDPQGAAMVRDAIADEVLATVAQLGPAEIDLNGRPLLRLFRAGRKKADTP